MFWSVYLFLCFSHSLHAFVINRQMFPSTRFVSGASTHTCEYQHHRLSSHLRSIGLVTNKSHIHNAKMCHCLYYHFNTYNQIINSIGRLQTGVMPYKCTACDTSFRYKVSQRTHKCAAQPPGMVIRQAGDLVQKLIKQNGLMVTLPDVGSTDLSIASHGYTVTPHHHIDPIEGGQFINSTQTLDAFVAESYARLGIDDDAKTTSTQMPDSPSITALMDALDNIQIPSPSERLQNVCLYSPSPPAVAAAAAAAVTPSADASSTGNDLFAQTLDTINEDSFKQLLYGNIDDLNHMIWFRAWCAWCWLSVCVFGREFGQQPDGRSIYYILLQCKTHNTIMNKAFDIEFPVS